jgi:hypothetical protein
VPVRSGLAAMLCPGSRAVSSGEQNPDRAVWQGRTRILRESEYNLELKIKILREINSNISYCILLPTFSLFLFILLYGIDICSSVPTIASVFIFAHLILTLLMTIKRSHALFEREYRNK